MSGCGSGDNEHVHVLIPSIKWFLKEDGYTSLAVALALLLSLTLVFAAAASTWTMSRSADVQEVADAAALAGCNVVAAFSTCAQVLDACVLTLGLTGITIMGCGLVLACIPVTVEYSESVLEAGKEVLELRKEFSETAARGLMAFESALPVLIAANSASCVSANSNGGTTYVGCAVPVPTTSNSDYGALDAIEDAAELVDVGEELAELTKEEEEIQERLDDALLRGWMADCGSTPYSLYERARSLSIITNAENPYYESTQGWNFGVPLSRARAYYAARLKVEEPLASDMESVTDSCCRRVFYAYAFNEVRAGYYIEQADGTVLMNLPSLPHNTEEVRTTTLYTDKTWPCTWEDGVRTLHSTLTCPYATGEPGGYASLEDFESQTVSRCPVCDMRTSCMGKVAAASTSITNGFEHWWREVVLASKDYEQARNELAQIESQRQPEADAASSLFGEALENISVTRPKICPPGAYGCVAVVSRAAGLEVPHELTDVFLSSQSLPQGVAVSAATLAIDEVSGDNNVLSRLADGVDRESMLGGVAGDVTNLWGNLLVAYADTYEGLSSVMEESFDSLDVVFGLGSWLRDRMTEIVDTMGLSPGDMRLKKPVLVSSAEVLAADGVDAEGTIRTAVRALANCDSYLEMLQVLGIAAAIESYGDVITVAEIPIPGSAQTIDLKIDLRELLEAA